MGPQATIRKVGNKWVLFTKDGSKRLGEFNSREDAIKRERQIEYFKHAGGSARAIDPYAMFDGARDGADEDSEDDDDADE